jgi:eukaryotic-like serine/threonine-protein kinase
VVAVLAAAVCAGARWGTAEDAPPAAATASRSAPTTTAAPSLPAGARAPEPPADPSPDLLATPAEPADWLPVVAELYRRRAEALGTASAEPLAAVYSDSSDRLAADTRFIEGLASAGEVLRGFAPSVVRVTAAEVEGDRADLELVDTVPAYEVVPSAGGPVVRTEPGRPEATVHMVLRRSADGWRIESAQRTG